MKNLCGLTCARVASHSSAFESATRDHRNFSSHHTESEERCSWVCFTLIKLTLSLLHCEHPKVAPRHTHKLSVTVRSTECQPGSVQVSQFLVGCQQPHPHCLPPSGPVFWWSRHSPAQSPEDSSHTQRLFETVHMECDFSHFK